jgi:hypothetical protein
MCTDKEKRNLLIYVGVLPVLLFIPIFWCICSGAVPPAPATTPPQATTSTDTSSNGDLSDPQGPLAQATGTDDEEQQTDEGIAQDTTPVAGAKTEARKRVHPALMFLMILCVGAIGGSLRMTGLAIYYFGKRKFYRSWLPYYYFAPLEGSLLAFLICLLVLSRFLTRYEFLREGGDPNSPLLLYALAAFTGLFTKNVLRKLKDVTDAAFGGVSNTDAA